MTTVVYEAPGHRLRLGGQCRDDDRDAIREALGTFARQAGCHLIVDLTAVTAIDQGVAEDLVAVRSSCGDGQTFAFIRKHGTPIDEALTAAEQSQSQSTRPTSKPQNGDVTTVFSR